MKTYYVIRRGWNAGNQQAIGAIRNPRDDFESNYECLVAIVEAATAEDAEAMFNGTAYNNQKLWATTNPRAAKGLTREIRNWTEEEEDEEGIYEDEGDGWKDCSTFDLY